MRKILLILAVTACLSFCNMSVFANTITQNNSNNNSEVINWENYKEYIPYVQEALRKNPDLQEIDGHSIAISEDDRSLILDNVNTGKSIDTPIGSYYGHYKCIIDNTTWVESYICNKIYFIPENYTGETSIINKSDYISPIDGTYMNKQYEVPRIRQEDKKADINYERKYLTNSAGESIRDENKKVIPFYVPYKYEQYHVIFNFKLGQLVKSFDISNMIDGTIFTNELYPEYVKNNKILYVVGSFIGIFDTVNEQFEVITTSCLDFSLNTNKGTLLFTDWDKTEYSCNCFISNEIKKTGKSVLSYTSNTFSLKKAADSVQDEFKDIQSKIQNGQHYSEYDYAFISDNNYVNIHLPYVYEYNGYNGLIKEEDFCCWLIENNADKYLSLYRNGQTVIKLELPGEGAWSICCSLINYHKDPNSGNLIIDTNQDRIITPEELKSSITNLNIMVYNNSSKQLYCYYNNLGWRKLAEDVVDYYNSYNTLYWMDSNGNAYCNKWFAFDGNALVGENVVSVYHAPDMTGFIVKPDDSQCNYEYNGYHILVYDEL